LIFTRTKHGADRVVKHLNAAGIGAEAIHGNKSQPQRERALGMFRSGSIKFLVATDIAARGIDVSGVSHVFNFELPNVAEQYVHRIGRTARAGATGIAMSFVADDERAYLRGIERLTKVKLTPVPLPEGFMEQARALPKPPQAKPTAQRRHDESRGRGDAPRTDRGDRPFRPARKPGSVGSHKGAVRKAGGGGGR
jgi:ATP-dependent RNA helicase RhlE